MNDTSYSNGKSNYNTSPKNTSQAATKQNGNSNGDMSYQDMKEGMQFYSENKEDI